MKWLKVTAPILLLVIAGAAIGIQEMRRYPDRVDSANTDTHIISVSAGESFRATALKLQDQGLVQSPLKFRLFARFSGAHIKLVPTKWGPPTFEIDGIKMLVSAKVSPWEDARRKVDLVRPRGKVVLDPCGGLGYYAAWCLAAGAARVLSFEKNPDVLWLRGLNPWSPPAGGVLSLTLGDIGEEIAALPDASVDAVLHDPPRFGIAGELYSLAFYRQLARVLRRKGRLFHYVGAPNALTSGRDVPREVARRLREAGFEVEPAGDGVLATRR